MKRKKPNVFLTILLWISLGTTFYCSGAIMYYHIDIYTNVHKSHFYGGLGVICLGIAGATWVSRLLVSLNFWSPKYACLAAAMLIAGIAAGIHTF